MWLGLAKKQNQSKQFSIHISTEMSTVTKVISTVVSDYSANVTKKTKIVDAFIVFNIFTAVVQVSVQLTAQPVR